MGMPPFLCNVYLLYEKMSRTALATLKKYVTIIELDKFERKL